MLLERPREVELVTHAQTVRDLADCRPVRKQATGQTHAQLEQIPIRGLSVIVVEDATGTVVVWDGDGREYVRTSAAGTVQFQVSGSIGSHTVLLFSDDGRLQDRTTIRVDCETGVESSDTKWSELMRMLKWNIFKGREAKVVPFDGRPYFLFSDWIRDHSFILRGKKYFFANLKDAVELFGQTQADDGMIYDFIMPKSPQSRAPFRRFANPRHAVPTDDPHYFFERVPVEAGLVGTVVLNYKDGSWQQLHVNTGQQVQNWWNPTDVPYNRRSGWNCRVAWQGSNALADVGTVVWGFDTPAPDKVIDSVAFVHAGTHAKWFVLGLTLSDAPKYFEAADAIYGWLENWNAGSILAALLEGLAGIQNRGLAYDSVRIAPRWDAAGTNDAKVTAKTEASGAYVSYAYRQRENGFRIELAANGAKRDFEILLPGKTPASLACTVNGSATEYSLKTVGQSKYLTVSVNEIAVSTIDIRC